MPRYSRLYRVFPWLEATGVGEPGHPQYVPTPQGHGRIDNPEHYLTLYLSDEPGGAIGEAFGNHRIWTRDLLQGPPALANSRRALATFDASNIDVIDLDDPAALVKRKLRPSRVVTRDRSTTQAWALDVYSEAKWHGVRWWSFYNPDYGSFGLWGSDGLKLVEVVLLEDELDLVKRVAGDLGKPWET